MNKTHFFLFICCFLYFFAILPGKKKQKYKMRQMKRIPPRMIRLEIGADSAVGFRNLEVEISLFDVTLPHFFSFFSCYLFPCSFSNKKQQCYSKMQNGINFLLVQVCMSVSYLYLPLTEERSSPAFV